MILNKIKNIFSEIKDFLNNDSIEFLFYIYKKRKNYFFINLFSGISSAFLEFLSLSLVLLIIEILAFKDKKIINWENYDILQNFNFIPNYFYSLSFINIFISIVICTLIVRIIQALANYFHSLSASYIEATYLSLITKRIYNLVFSLSYEHVSQYKIGDLSDYINSSPQTVRNFVISLNELFLNVLISIVYIIFMINISVWNIPLLIIIFIFFNKLQSIILPQIKILSSKVLKNTVNLSKNIIEKFQAFRFIYSNGLNNFIIDDMDKKTDLLEMSIKKNAIKTQILPILVSILPVIFLAFLAILYATLSDKGELLSLMAILFISLQRLNTRFVGIARAIANLAEFTPRLDRTIYLLKTEKFKFRRTGGKNIKLNLKKIEFSRVNFQYSKTANFNLKNINFSLKSGETTALVGFSGSGKSSILDLLIGLFEPNSGEIFIDGVNLKDLNLINWQKKVSIVNQDPFLLNDTIINNIKFGIENVTLKNIKNACIQSGANEFIENLPNSYNTIIGERGFKLSGGQRQRISIARALLKNSSLLILDEATSALDSKNELLIKDNISKLRQKKITLIVAHRLSTIKDADNILVLNNGEIVERGDHNSLLNQNQIYTKLWNIQSKS